MEEQVAPLLKTIFNSQLKLTESYIKYLLLNKSIVYESLIFFYNTIKCIKHKVDNVVNCVVVSKARNSLEPLIFPTARIIGNVSSGSTNRIYVDDADFFEYEKDEDTAVTSIDVDALIVNDIQVVDATLTATVSAAGTIS